MSGHHIQSDPCQVTTIYLVSSWLKLHVATAFCILVLFLLQREEHIPWQLSYEHDVVFCLSAHNVKISKRDGQEVNSV